MCGNSSGSDGTKRSTLKCLCPGLPTLSKSAFSPVYDCNPKLGHRPSIVNYLTVTALVS